MYIYILIGTLGHYVGITKNLEQRFKWHQKSYPNAMSKRQAGTNLKIEHWWNVSDRYTALKIEKYLQKLSVHDFWQLVKDVAIDLKYVRLEALKLPDTSFEIQTKFNEQPN